MRGSRGSALLAVGALTSGCTRGAFACEEDDDCVTGEGRGRCEPTGWCSFADPDCPSSGRRYGERTGDGLAGTCVAPQGASGSTSSTVVSTSGASAGESSTADPSATTMPVEPQTSSGVGEAESSTTGTPLDPDLVAWYPFDEDAFAGAVLDAAGDHDGSCAPERCPQRVVGVIGGAGGFDGDDDIVHVAFADALAVTGEVSVASWVRYDRIGPSGQTFASKPFGPDNFDTWEMQLTDNGTLRWNMLNTNSTVRSATQGAPRPGEWIHLAGTWDGAVIQLYVNGAAVASDGVGGVLQEDRGLTLGGGIDDLADDNHLEGALDDVRVYRRALQPAEIAELAQP